MFNIKTRFIASILASFILLFISEVHAQLPDGTHLTIGPNSSFEVPGATVGPVPLNEGNDGLVLGDVVPALPGSFHLGPPDGNPDELGGIVQSYDVFSNTGTFWTEFPVVDLDGGIVDMSGWRAAWGDAPIVRFDNPTGFLSVTGNTYVLDYAGIMVDGPFAGLEYILHLEGDVILPGTVLPDGTRLSIGGNSYFEVPGATVGPVPLVEGNDGLVLGDTVPALPGSFHLGPPDDNPDELGGIVQSYDVFSNTGTFWTEFPVVDLDGGIVDMSGWHAAWGDAPIVRFDNPTGFLGVTGNTYVLDYAGIMVDGPLAGLEYILHLEGEVILPGTILPNGSRLSIGSNSYFEMPDIIGPERVALSDGIDGLVIGDVVPALPGSFHPGPPTVSPVELGGIVQSYELGGNTGTFWTEFPVVDLGGGVVDMSGWRDRLPVDD